MEITQKNNEFATIIVNKFGFYPSEEQLTIINDLVAKKNVSVNAVAGSGKTTLVLMLGAVLESLNKKVLHLTYNTILSKENEAKVKKMKLDHVINSRTLHSYALKVSKDNGITYDTFMMNDPNLEILLKHDFVIKDHFDYLILDETQDLNEIQVLFLKQAYNKMQQEGHAPTILVIGDHKQAIYGFIGASKYFLTDIDQFLGIESIKRTISHSFRLPSNVAEIINKAFIHDETSNIIGKNEQGKLIISDLKNNKSPELDLITQICNYVDEIQRTQNASDEDFFILAFSLNEPVFNNKLSLHYLSQELINRGHKVYYPTNDDKQLKEKELKNKIVFSTVHQVKGRERKYVIFPFFNLIKYYQWLKEPHLQTQIIKTIPNLHYVAITRSLKELWLNMDSRMITKDSFPPLGGSSNLMPYIDYHTLFNSKDVVWKYTNPETFMQATKNLFSLPTTTKGKYHTNISPSDYGRYLPYEEQQAYLQLLSQIEIPGDLKLKVQGLVTSVIQTQDKKKFSYVQEVAITNALYLLECYLQTNHPDEFKDELVMMYYVLKDSLEDRNRTRLYVDKIGAFLKLHDAEMSKDVVAWWNKSATSVKVQFIAYYNNVQSNTDSYLQLPHFNWLDNFNDYETVNKIFAAFNIKNMMYESPLEVIYSSNENNNCSLDFAFLNFFSGSYDIDLHFDKQLEHLGVLQRTDLLLPEQVFELKATDDLEFHHKTQILAYLWTLNEWHKYVKKILKTIKIDLDDIDSFLRLDLSKIINLKDNKNINISNFASGLLKTWPDYHKYEEDKKKKGTQKKQDELVALYSSSFRTHLTNFYHLCLSKRKQGVLLNYNTGKYFIYDNNEDIVDACFKLIMAHKIKGDKEEKLEDVVNKFNARANKLKQ